jgi:hypothetical protein
MQFVFVDADDRYAVDPVAKECLLRQKNGLSVISIIGRYRTGKSSLMNAVLGVPDIFSTSPTVQAHTKGIHLYPVPGSDALLLDTEGLGSMGASQNHDAAIFALATLLSTTCIINTMGSISTTELEDLRLATKIAALVMDHTELRTLAPRPDLCWVLRDFVLELANKDGSALLPGTYLDQCLYDYSDLTTLFPVRTCFPLPRPADGDADVRSMTNTRPEFTTGLARVRDHVLRPAAKPTTGAQLVALAEAFCVALNQNLVPDLGSVWDMVCASSREHAASQAREVFLKNTEDLPRAMEDALDTWCRHCLGPPTGDEVIRMVSSLLVTHPSLLRARELQTQFVVESTQAEHKLLDLQMNLDETAEALTNSETRLGTLVGEALRWQQQVTELQDQVAGQDSRQTEVTDDIMKIIEGARVQATENRTQISLLQQQLTDSNTARSVLQTQVDDVARNHQRDKLLGERREQRGRELQEDVTDLRTKLHKASTDVAVWRTRFDDAEVRANKRQKVSDTSSTDHMVQRAELDYLRTRTKDVDDQLRTLRREYATVTHDLQTTRVRLALESTSK